MRARLTLTLALLLICTGGAALATTPDGVPPSLETVCDMEQGAAYGLCNAYCEAMDCESATPHASTTACAKVGSKFQQITGRSLPCEVSCPCVGTNGGFDAALSGQSPILSCIQSEDGVLIPEPTDPNNVLALSVNIDGQWICGTLEGGIGALPISPEQGQYCAQLLEQAANSQGVTCTAPE